MGGNLARQQNSLMNVFFAAHKHNIVVDVAEIGWFFSFFNYLLRLNILKLQISTFILVIFFYFLKYFLFFALI